jgi:cell division protein FtsW
VQTTRRSSSVDRSGQRKHKPDYGLLVITIILLAIGLIVVYSIGPGLASLKNVDESYFINKQLIAISIGFVAFLVTAFTPLRFWKRMQKYLVIAGVVATLVALMMPVTPEYPAHRWIRFGGFSLQSVELIKYALLIALAAFFAKQKSIGLIGDDRKTLKPVAICVAIMSAFVAVAQKDLGSFGVLIAIVTAMGYVAGVPLKRVVVASLLVVGALVLLVLPFEYRRQRVTTYLNPERDCQNAGYQACQALIAIGSGGLSGKGIGHGVQAFGYLPEAANDSIFAILAEKFGFLGTSVLIGLFMALFTRLKNILERSADDFSRLIMTGILAWMSTQTLINIGAMVGLLPLKGITLPFISYGGTSIILILTVVGLAFNISRYTSFGIVASQERSRNEDNTDWRRNRRSYNATSSNRTRT